jgi:hypothetical protein
MEFGSWPGAWDHHQESHGGCVSQGVCAPSVEGRAPIFHQERQDRSCGDPQRDSAQVDPGFDEQDNTQDKNKEKDRGTETEAYHLIRQRSRTRRLKDGGELLGITVLDHIVLGDDRYFSFADNQAL